MERSQSHILQGAYTYNFPFQTHHISNQTTQYLYFTISMVVRIVIINNNLAVQNGTAISEQYCMTIQHGCICTQNQKLL